MNNLGVLRGTRMGRPVKTEKQVLEEIASMPVDQEQEMEPGSNLETDQVGADVFKFDRLTQDQDGWFVLENLQIPGGTWHKLVLEPLPFAEGVECKPAEFFSYSEGNAVIENGRHKLTSYHTSRPGRMITSKALYWFMRAAYMCDGSDTSKQLRSFLVGGLGQRIYITADLAKSSSEINGAGWLKLFTNGWPHNHVLSIEKSLPIQIVPSTSAIQDGNPCAPLVYALTGDPSMTRVAEVMQWMGQHNQEITLSIHPKAYDQRTTCAISFRPNLGVIQLDRHINSKYNSFSLIAPESEFTHSNLRGGQ